MTEELLREFMLEIEEAGCSTPSTPPVVLPPSLYDAGRKTGHILPDDPGWLRSQLIPVTK
jgi:hypothetical protein